LLERYWGEGARGIGQGKSWRGHYIRGNKSITTPWSKLKAVYQEFEESMNNGDDAINASCLQQTIDRLEEDLNRSSQSTFKLRLNALCKNLKEQKNPHYAENAERGRENRRKKQRVEEEQAEVLV
jgi:hypothetical protein